MINKKWCDPRNISILSRSCLPHLEHLSIICHPFYLPREILSIIVTAVYIPPLADTSLPLSKLHNELSGYINKYPDAAFIITGDFKKANLKQLTFINMYSVQLENRIHWIIATLSLKMPTMPAHYRPLANRTMPLFFSHRNINKGSFRNPRWRGKCWSSHSEAMLQAALDDVDWDILRASSSDVSEFTDVALSFVNTLTEQATETVTRWTF